MKKKVETPEVPKVTVIIPTYNRAEVISQAIQSVMKQSLNNWKAIIIDDGSTDNTEEAVKPYLQKDSRISYYRMPQNMGVCHVLNKAIELVDTEYICQLDSDDWLEEHALEVLLNKMEQKPNTSAIAYGNYKTFWANGVITLNQVRGFRSTEKYELITYGPMVYPRFYRKACLQEVGGWETNDKYNGRYMEDRRILFKLIEKYDFLWVDDHLYNLTRLTEDRLSSLANKEKYLELKRDLIIRTLEKWGREYTAEFLSENEKQKGQGWLPTRLIPNNNTEKGEQYDRHMNEFKSITVKRKGKKLVVHNPTSYTLIGKGLQGAVFKITEDRCVKIFLKPKNMEKEKEAMIKGQGLSFMPKFYESGTNYIVWEYIDGPSLRDYLKDQGTISESIAHQIIVMIKEMKRIGFTQLDRCARRHILVDKEQVLKVIDHVNSFDWKASIPIQLFDTLSKLRLIDRFLEQVKVIDSELYSEWKNYLIKFQKRK